MDNPTKSSHLKDDQRCFIARYIRDEKITKVQQVESALEYFRQFQRDTIDVNDFEKECGIGIYVDPNLIDNLLSFNSKMII